MTNKNLQRKLRRKRRVSSNIVGTKARPRVSVYRSNQHIYAQVINDITGKTLVQANDTKTTKGTKTERAKEVGRAIGVACLAAKIKKVVFDRN